jgi:seryl-tRNA synthetase
MLDISFIRDNPDLIKKNSADRGVDVQVDVLLDLDTRRRALIAQIGDLRAQRNQGSKTKPTDEEIGRMKQVGVDIAALEEELGAVQSEYEALLVRIPNMTHPDAPVGGEDDFKVIATVGEPPQFSFEPKDHEQLFTDLGLIDFERGTKVAGTKFYFTRGALVRLNQALIQYGIDIVTAHGYELIETPDVAKDEILSGIGFAPRGPETQVYSIENTPLSLIGTAEITVGGYHAGEILDLSAGPKKYVALSHCFRTEAGAAGRVSKGLYRVHQFTKLEMFVFCKPEESPAMHQELLTIEREITDGLRFPYRVIDVASGDLGGPAYRKYDIEAWMTTRDGYGEITSTSDCTDYQARRLNIRYRTPDGKTDFVHTLNGTAVVSSRLPIAIAENFQQENGTIVIPEVLRPYMGGLEVIR